MKLKLLRKLKRWEIKVPIFESEIELVVADDIDKIDDYVSDTFNVDLDKRGPAVGRTYLLPSNLIIAGFTLDCDEWTIIHECGHIIWSIKYIIGFDDEETFCYLLEWVTKQVMLRVRSND